MSPIWLFKVIVSPLKTPCLKGLFPEKLHQCSNAEFPFLRIVELFEQSLTEVPKLMVDASELGLTLTVYDLKLSPHILHTFYTMFSRFMTL